MAATPCAPSITADIINDCKAKPSAGMEQQVWVFNRADITATIDGSNANLATSLDVAATKKGYKITGFRKNMNAGADAVISETAPKKWNQYFSFHSWDVEAAEVGNIDGLDNVVIVYESKAKGANTDGAFHMLGYHTGLYVSADAKRVNDNDGVRTLELTNLAGSESPVSEIIVLSTDYATTLSMLNALLVTQV